MDVQNNRIKVCAYTLLYRRKNCSDIYFIFNEIRGRKDCNTGSGGYMIDCFRVVRYSTASLPGHTNLIGFSHCIWRPCIKGPSLDFLEIKPQMSNIYHLLVYLQFCKYILIL